MGEKSCENCGRTKRWTACKHLDACSDGLSFRYWIKPRPEVEKPDWNDNFPKYLEKKTKEVEKHPDRTKYANYDEEEREPV
jgi:hypothetical protein